MGLDAYKKFGPDPRYGTYWGLKHETWHNLLMGLSYHPELSKILKMPAPDDSRADAAALQFIVDNNKALGLLNGRTYEVGSTFSSDWAKKKLYMDICKKNPLSCLELTVWVKPKALFNLFIWTAQFLPKDRDWLDEYNYKMISISDINRKKQDLLYNPFRWEIFTVVCLSILIGFKDLRDNQLKSLAYMGGIFISSLSIPILVYPAIFLLAVTYTTATALFYTCLGISLIFLFERLKALMNIQKTKSLSR